MMTPGAGLPSNTRPGPARWRLVAAALGVSLAGCAHTAVSSELRLQQVVLYRNGIGYFERSGHFTGDRLTLRFRGHEIDDVLKTLTVIDRTAGKRIGNIAVRLPQPPPGRKAAAEQEVALEVVLGSAAARELLITYAVPTPAWKATYRLVLPAREDRGLLQAWAMVDNSSGEDWSAIQLALDSGAPLSFATDLRTPQFVARPDATGQLISPVAAAVVRSEKALPGDADGDGIPDEKDLCPNEPEDKDGFEDGDGCPDPDNDKDRICDPWVQQSGQSAKYAAICTGSDKCPNEPETYNGYEDDDGCPDRGRVVVHMARIEVLDKVYFATNADTIKPGSKPILDAIAATLNGNAQITAVAVQGHAADTESDPWGLSARRAGNVRGYLHAAGVKTTLKLLPFGATQPVDRRANEDARSRNRRVEFVILKRSAEDAEPTPGRNAAGARRPPAAATAAVGAVPALARYDLPGRLSVGKSSSVLVTLIDGPMTAEDIFFFRPDSGVAGSEHYPFRAARVRNDRATPLVPGVIAVYTPGGYVGEGLLDRMNPAETAFIPFALDSSATVRVESAAALEPVRLVSLVDGVAHVENHDVAKTRYEITVGQRAPGRLFIRHARRAGYEARGLPPRTASTPSAYLVPIPLNPSRTSVLEVREQRVERREIRVLDDADAGRIELYLRGSDLPRATLDSVRAILVLRRTVAKLAQQIEESREQLADAGVLSGELRQNLLAITKSGGDAALKRTLTARLRAAMEESAKAARALSSTSATHVETRARLRDALRALRVGEQPGEP